METNLDPWKTHNWFDRPLEINRGEKANQFVCRKCGRGFVRDTSGKRYAIHVSAFAIHRFSVEVTDRWPSEPCPNEHQLADLQAGQTRLVNESSATESGVQTK
jgi:hypothetical protein